MCACKSGGIWQNKRSEYTHVDGNQMEVSNTISLYLYLSFYTAHSVDEGVIYFSFRVLCIPFFFCYLIIVYLYRLCMCIHLSLMFLFCN